MTAVTKTTRWGRCPKHAQDGKKLTPLVLDGEGAWVFKYHFKRIGRVNVPCPGSGLEYEGTPREHHDR